MGILPGHSPFLARLKPGQVRVQLSSEETQVFYISSGLLEVQPQIVTVLADYAENAANLTKPPPFAPAKRLDARCCNV